MKKILKFFDKLGVIILCSIPSVIGSLLGLLIINRFIKWISANPDKIPNVIIGAFIFIIVSCIVGEITRRLENKRKKKNEIKEGED